MYSDETYLFLQVLMLGFILSIPTSFMTEQIKKSFITSRKYFYVILNFVLSMIFAFGFKLAFASETINIAYASWLGICTFLGSTGFYKKIKDSDGFLGKYFKGITSYLESDKFVPSERLQREYEDNRNKEESKEVDEEKTEGNTSPAPSEENPKETVDKKPSESSDEDISSEPKPTPNPNETVEPTPTKPTPPEVAEPKPTPEVVEPKTLAIPKITYAGTGDNDNELRVKWEKVKGATSYRVAIYNHSYEDWYYYNTEANALEVQTAVGGRKYTVKIRSINGENDSEYTDDKDAKIINTPLPKDMFEYPTKFIGISDYFRSQHLGIDLGWNRNYGGPNADIMSATPGKVISTGMFGTAGNMVKVRYDDKKRNTTWYAQYKHLSAISVKTGQTLKVGSKVGKMGATGGDYGPHLHFDLIRCPYGYSYSQNSTTRPKYSVNPVKYLYATKDHVVGNDTQKKYKILKV